MKKRIKKIALTLVQKNKPNKQGTSSTQMRITYGSDQYYFSLPKDVIHNGKKISTHVTPEDFDRATTNTQNKRLTAEDRVLRDFLADYQTDALKAAKEFVPFNREDFMKGFFKQVEEDFTKSDVFSAFQIYCDTLRSEGRFKTAQSYWTAKLSIEAFTKSDLAGHKKSKLAGKKKIRENGVLRFEEITPMFLSRYERSMLENGNSKATIGMHLRALRAVFRKYFGTEATVTNYPFGKDSYQIPTGTANKRALPSDDLKILLDYEPNSTGEKFALSLWKTSYYCGGLNIADIIRLTPKMFHLSNDGYAVADVVRQKTKRSRNETKIEVILPPERWSFISRFLEENAERFKRLLSLQGDDFGRSYNILISDTNAHLARICHAIGIEKVTTYHARHSAATTLLRKNVPIEYISKMLGHQSIVTTQTYLGNYQQEQKKDFARML